MSRDLQCQYKTAVHKINSIDKKLRNDTEYEIFVVKTADTQYSEHYKCLLRPTTSKNISGVCEFTHVWLHDKRLHEQYNSTK